MSKKMMKRSLALGALMAFVITGSAWAEVHKTEVDKGWGRWQYSAMQNSGETLDSENLKAEWSNRAVGGWFANNTANVPSNKTVDTNVTIKNGTWDTVVGGNYFNDMPYVDDGNGNLSNKVETKTSTANTNVVINGGKVKQVVGGNHISDLYKYENTWSGSSNLTINGGEFGSETVVGDCHELLIIGGDLLKDGKGSAYHTIEADFGAKSTVGNVNTIINKGTFNAAVIGASAAIQYYGHTGLNPAGSNYERDLEKGLFANVKNATTIINGGEFNNHPIVAGGFAYGHNTTANVEELAILKIIGSEDKKPTFGKGVNIYSGGLHGTYRGNGINVIADVEKANVEISNVTINDFYGRGANVVQSGGDGSAWKYTTKEDAIVNTDLSLTNVTAGTIDLPKGTLTLADNNKVNNMTIGAGVEKIEIASKNLAGGYSLQGNGENSKLTVEGAKKLTITGIEAGTYDIIGDFKTVTGVEENIKFDQETSLLQAEAIFKDGVYKVEVTAKSGSDIATNLDVTESTGNFVENIISEGNDEAKDFLDKLIDPNVSADVRNDTLAAVQKMGEAGGNSATAASIVKNVTGVTNDRLSFNCGHSAPHKGGHGVGLFEEGSGADVWVEYVHGKDEVEDMPSTAGASSYEGQYNGLVMGVDFKKVNKFQSGIAFNYGEGDTNSIGSAVRTHSDYDFWGVGYYGNIHNDDSNVIFDISYAQTDSDVTQNNSGTAFEANPETTTWSAGVKLEKLYQNENVQIVPYTGLRYMSIDADDYSTRNGEFYYSMDRQDIWLLPLGVSIRQEIANDNGWTVSPRVDLSYIWAFGDTNSNMEVKSPFAGVSQLGYDVMDDGSFLGLVGIEAHKGQWGYGVAYSYQKGDHSESKKWYVDVNYSF